MLALVVLGAAPSVFSAAVTLALVVVMGTSVWMVLRLMWRVDGPGGPSGAIHASRAVCLLRRSLRSPRRVFGAHWFGVLVRGRSRILQRGPGCSRIGTGSHSSPRVRGFGRGPAVAGPRGGRSALPRSVDGIEGVFVIAVVIGDVEVVIAVVSGEGGGIGIGDMVSVCWGPAGERVGRTASTVLASRAGVRALAVISCCTTMCSRSCPPVREVLNASQHFVGVGPVLRSCCHSVLVASSVIRCHRFQAR